MNSRLKSIRTQQLRSRLNREEWDVREDDVRNVNGRDFKGIDLLAGGVPCPPFSLAGKQLGADDERDLFPEALRLVKEANPAAVMLENVKGLATARFATYRQSILDALDKMGYDADWQLLYSSEFGVPQLRPRFILVAMKRRHFRKFEWPRPIGTPPTVGSVLYPLMASDGWGGADAWAERAKSIAPTIVGGSKKHGGADLGPTRAKEAWLRLGVDGKGIADEAPGADYLTITSHGLQTKWLHGCKGSIQIGSSAGERPRYIVKSVMHSRRRLRRQSDVLFARR